MATDSTPATVLIVEDEVDLADLYAAWLGDDYQVRTAYSGSAALEALDEAVDVVLLDRRMPGLSGDEVLATIREEGLDCRVVIVSAVTPDFDVIGMGFDDYLTKPVNSDELHDAVDRMLARSEYDEAVRELQQLVATRSALETQYTAAELEQSEEFQALSDRIDARQAEASDAIEEFGEADFEAAFRDLEADGPDDSTGFDGD
ncbi:MAG: response regulator [Halobacteriales archaeon]